MSTVLRIARREVGSFLNTWWGWAIVLFVLLIAGLFFNAFAVGNSPRYSAEVLEQFFFYLSGVAMFAAAFGTMRLLAEERSSGTMALLQTAPISDGQIVLGKFLGAFAFLAFVVLLTAYMPLLIQINGKVSYAQIATGYLGVLAIGGTCVAIGTFGSAVAKNQLLALVITAFIIVFFLLGWLLGRVTDPPISDVFSYLAIFDRHFQPFMRGRINTENLVFFGTVSAAFLVLSTRVLQARRNQ